MTMYTCMCGRMKQSDEGIFMVYSLCRKSYRVLNKRINCVEESVHIVLDELKTIPEITPRDNDEAENNAQE